MPAESASAIGLGDIHEVLGFREKVPDFGRLASINVNTSQLRENEIQGV
jgi:hypothetical protein